MHMVAGLVPLQIVPPVGDQSTAEQIGELAQPVRIVAVGPFTDVVTLGSTVAQHTQRRSSRIPEADHHVLMQDPAQDCSVLLAEPFPPLGVVLYRGRGNEHGL
jgi:hypothetical protein